MRKMRDGTYVWSLVVAAEAAATVVKRLKKRREEGKERRVQKIYYIVVGREGKKQSPHSPFSAYERPRKRCWRSDGPR